MNFDRQNHSDRMTDTVALPASADGGEGFTFNLPAIITDTHHEAGERFMEFFAATIRNRNTRAAYIRAVSSFLSWEGVSGLASLRDVRPLHVAAYIEECCDQVSAPTVKLRLAALRGLFDWLVRSGVMDGNPAHAVRGPTHEVVRGKTDLPLSFHPAAT